MSSIYLCNEFWYYQTYIPSSTGKKKVQRSLRTKDKSIALRRQKEFDEKLLREQIQFSNRRKFKDSVKDYLTHRTKLSESGQLSSHTLRSDKGSLKEFEKFLETLPKVVHLNEFDDSDRALELLQGFVDHRRARKVSPNTIRRDLRHLSIMFTHFVRPPHRVLSQNPLTNFQLPRAQERISLPDQKDWLSLRSYLRNQIEDGKADLTERVVFVQIETGCRISEVLKLKWGRQDTDVSGSGDQWSTLEKGNSQIRIYSKRRERVVPISKLGGLKKFFDGIQNDTEEGWVFPSPRTGEPLNISQFSRSFRALLKKAKITKTFSSHGVRHGFISFLVNSGLSSDQIGWIVGHSSSEITRIYSHPDTGSLSKILSKLK